MPDGEPPAPRAPDSGQGDLFGLLRIGQLSIALPVEVIREVVPCPADLAPFPSTIPEITGAVELRGQLIPVFDLRLLLGSGTDFDQCEDRIVAIMRHDGGMFGLIAHGIDGVAVLPEKSRAGIKFAGPSGDSALVKSTFVQGGRRGVILNPVALAGHPGLPTVEDRHNHSDSIRQTSEPTLVFKVAGLQCALPAACVDASLPSQSLLPAPVADPLWIAMLRHNEMEIPAIDTLALLGQGQMPAGRVSGGAIVLRCNLPPDEAPTGYGLVALLIDSVDDIVRVEPDKVAVLDNSLSDVPFAAGILELACRPRLLLDANSIVADERLVRLSRIKQKARSGGQPGSSAAEASLPLDPAIERTAEDTFLVFSVEDQTFAAPLADVDEILSSDTPVFGLGSVGKNVVGILTRRCQGVPVVDFGKQVGLAEKSARNFVLVSRAGKGKQRAGFLVDTLHSVDRAAVQRLDNDARHLKTGAAPSALEQTIKLDNGTACGVIDLAKIADAALGALLSGSGEPGGMA